MSKKVALVGHCGPDSSYLRMAVTRAVPGASVSSIDDSASLDRAIGAGIDLLLFNRQLEYGFDTDEGVELIRALRPKYPNVRMMLVTNYPDAQQAAIKIGALPGFGKREIGTPKVTEMLKAALSESAVAK